MAGPICSRASRCSKRTRTCDRTTAFGQRSANAALASSPPSSRQRVASLFLCWLVYFHRAGRRCRHPPPLSARAQRPAQRPLRRRAGHRLLFSSARSESPPTAPAMFTAFHLLLAFPGELHHQSRAARRHAFHGPGRHSAVLFSAAYLPHRPVGRGAADDPDHLFSFAQRPLSRSIAALPGSPFRSGFTSPSPGSLSTPCWPRTGKIPCSRFSSIRSSFFLSPPRWR